MNIIIIYNTKFELSKKLAIETLESCKTLDLVAEPYDGIVSETLQDYLNHNGLVINSTMKNMTASTFACAASHHSVWQKVQKSNIPTVVLEHDAIVLRDPNPLLDFVQDVCHLDAFLPFNSNIPQNSTEYFDGTYNRQVLEHFEPGVSAYPKNSFYGPNNITGSCFRGAYGYLLTPTGASKLLEFTKRHGLFPADKTICEAAVTLQKSNATYVRLNKFFNTLESQRKFSTRQ